MSGEPSAQNGSGAPRRQPDEIWIGNEFARVRVRKVRTRNGERLEIWSPFFGYQVRLDALALEALSWQPDETFSDLLQGSSGPLPSPEIEGVDQIAGGRRQA